MITAERMESTWFMVKVKPPKYLLVAYVDEIRVLEVKRLYGH